MNLRKLAFFWAAIAVMPHATKCLGREKDPLSSAEHRRESEWILYAYPLAGTLSAFGPGIGGSAKVEDDLWLEGIYFSTDSGGGRFDINFAMLRAKQFVSNSFFIQAGFGQQQMHEDAFFRDKYEFLYGNSDDGTHTTLYNRSVGIVGGIGNQWQWRHFTIGGEWAGLYVPLKTLASRTNGSSADQREAKRFGQRPVFLFMGLTLGYAF